MNNTSAASLCGTLSIESMKTLSHRSGFLMAFLAGFVIMATELLATPLLAPAFGTSLPVWTVVIGIFLIALSIGYALGGRLADRSTSVRPLVIAWSLAAVWLLAAPLLAQGLFPEIGIKALVVGSATAGTVLATFIGMLIAFVVPMVLLSMTSPFIIGYWQRQRPHDPGALTGRVYAVGTIGSFLGVVAGPLIGMPLIGTRSTLFVLAGLLAMVAIWQGVQRLVLRVVLLGCVIALQGALLWWAAPVRSGDDILAQEESYIQYIAVTQVEDERRLEVNEGLGVQSSYVPGHPYSGTYVDIFALLPYTQPEKTSYDVFLVGLAGGAIPRVMLETGAPVAFEAVEFDPVIDRLAREHLALDDIPQVHTTIGDGRVVLRHHTQQIQNGEREPYDYVFVDAFQNETTVPPHLVTREWFQDVERALAHDGVLAMNLVTLDPEGPLATRTLNTLASVFASVRVLEVPQYGNLFLIATNDPSYETHLSEPQRDVLPEELFPFLPVFELSSSVSYQPEVPIFTDDRAPTSLLTASMVWKAMQ